MLTIREDEEEEHQSITLFNWNSNLQLIDCINVRLMNLCQLLLCSHANNSAAACLTSHPRTKSSFSLHALKTIASQDRIEHSRDWRDNNVDDANRCEERRLPGPAMASGACVGLPRRLPG